MKHSLFLLILFITLNSFQLFETSKDEQLQQPFDINDYSWLVGSWKGDGFGGISEEIWSKPEKGVMMGMYRQIKDG